MEQRAGRAGVPDRWQYAARLGQRGAIAALLDQPEIRLSIEAAWVLVDTDNAYDQAVCQVVASWPDVAPYPAGEVRDPWPPPTS